jgi:hypothetical protein
VARDGGATGDGGGNASKCGAAQDGGAVRDGDGGVGRVDATVKPRRPKRVENFYCSMLSTE